VSIGAGVYERTRRGLPRAGKLGCPWVHRGRLSLAPRGSAACRAPWLVLVALALQACSTVPPRPESLPATGQGQDGPPPYQRDLSAIPDPVPRWEPASPYGNPVFYDVDGHRYWVQRDAAGYQERGIASWYGWKFQGKRTSSGEIYDVWGMTAAHRTLPIPCYLQVTNLASGRSVVVRVNDRGPFKPGRLLDLSYAAAAKLGVFPGGTAPVALRVVPTSPETPAPSSPGERIYLQAGAFSSRSNAARLEQQLREASIEPVRIDPVTAAGGTLYRVRVGPIPDEVSADRFQHQLIRLGVPAVHTVVD
jgi:rare lipoprotein A